MAHLQYISYLLPLFLMFCLQNLPFSSSSSLTSLVAGNDTDHLALLSFKSKLTSNSLQITETWNESTHFCKWFGVTCDRRQQRVISLSLPSMSLSGSLSPAIGNLSFLQDLWLYNNSFWGNIPSEIGRLSQLMTLRLGNNSFSGGIPVNISQCFDLVELNLGWNNLGGNIPTELHSLLKLELIFLLNNYLTGTIPDFLGNFSALQGFVAMDNNFQGVIPDTLGQLRNLTSLGLGVNNLSGTIPPSFLNLSSLITLSLEQNNLDGNLPPDIGLRFPRLKLLSIGQNYFTGTIPVSLANASQLVNLRLYTNQFTGRVPNFGELQNLERLVLETNQLGYGEADDLSFLSSLLNSTKLQYLFLTENNFGGVLPKLIGNFSKLVWLAIDTNLIVGSIPTELGELLNLQSLHLEFNQINGSIPDSIGKLEKLGMLYAAGNELSGHIPSSLGNLTRLVNLYLGQNYLQGSIPSNLSKCQSLNILNISQNDLSGTIPKEIFGMSYLSILLDLSYNSLNGSLLLEPGGLSNLVSLDVSNNRLSGKIPSSLGSCTSLAKLSISGNYFQGTIPPSLSSLKSIEVLDFSSNNLTGKIPEYFQNLPFLRELNLSFNDFAGSLPLEGIFRNATAVSVVGNGKLCGGVLELQLPKCKTSKNHGVSYALKLVLLPISGGILVLVLVLFFVSFYRRIQSKNMAKVASTLDILPKVSYRSLYRATDGFSPANLIGSGMFSNVYKGTLVQNDTVAVKVLNLTVRGALRSFVAECEALRQIRHRNLVKVITCCSSIDFQRNDFKAIVYAYMVNGSLDNWLHPNPREGSGNLNLLHRLNIAIDVASALEYLHTDCGKPLVHCDLKPSNVLLDTDLVAHIGDFGLAKFIAEITQPGLWEQSSSIGFKGTIGYAAPEYAMGGQVSTCGDVYSYGIFLLELFTGKRPTDDMFNNHMNLHGFVKMAIPERVMEISDPALLCNEEENRTRSSFQSHQIKECLMSIYRIGIACSVEVPKERTDIGEVTAELHQLKEALLCTRLH